MVEDAVGPWSKGGREVRYAALLPRLEAQGFELEVFTMRWWSEPPRGSIRYTAICPAVPMYKGERRSFFQASVFAVASLRLLWRRFDVLLVDQMPILHLFPLRLVAWLKRVDLVVQWHEVWGADYWRDYLGGAGPVAAAIERLATRVPDRLVAGSADVRDRLLELGVPDASVSVVPNAVDKRQLDPAGGTLGSAELVAVGRLMAHKNVADAIRAVAELRRRGRAVTLEIVGDGPERTPLAQLAVELGVDDEVVFRGAMEEDEDVRSIVRAARVFVFPSEREGFGLSVAESLALGTPVVCVGHPGNDATRLIDEGVTGSVVPPGDVGSFVDAVEHWLDAPASPALLSATFWDAHPELSWDASARTLATVMRASTAAGGAGTAA